jgi:PE-PPE domain
MTTTPFRTSDLFPSGTFIFVPGTGMVGVSLGTGADMFGGYFADHGGYTITDVSYPADIWPFSGATSIDDFVAALGSGPTIDDMLLGPSVNAGVSALDAAIKNPSNAGPKIICGLSQGAMVVSQELHALTTDPAAPPAGELQWICAADESRINGPLRRFWSPGTTILPGLFDYQLISTAPTQYDGMVICQQWDGFADWPERGNMLANLNALAGILMLHGNYGAHFGAQIGYTHLPDAQTKILNTTVYSGGGKGTTYLLGSWPLPIFDMFPASTWDIGSLILLSAVNAAYSRSTLDYT